jgi:hypothetical protein
MLVLDFAAIELDERGDAPQPIMDLMNSAFRPVGRPPGGPNPYRSYG